MKTIKILSCRSCPYLRYPWNSAITNRWACGNSFAGDERPKGEKYWLGGDADPGDRLMYKIDGIPEWCPLNDEEDKT